MTTTTFIAFGVKRRTESDYPWASRTEFGHVRFHGSRDAAHRAAGRFGRIERTRIFVTDSQMATLRTLVAASEARVDARTAAVLERHGWVTVQGGGFDFPGSRNYGGTIARITDAGRAFVAAAVSA